MPCVAVNLPLAVPFQRSHGPGRASHMKGSDREKCKKGN